MRRFLLLLALAAAALLGAVTPVAAHPMGNFSINHYTAITVGGGTVQLLYLVDMAEIPTFQELSNLGAASAAGVPAGLRARYLEREARALSRGLHLSFDGQRLPLRVRVADLLFPPGAGGLSTERIYLVLDAPIPHPSARLVYRDDNFPGRAGWKEIVAASAAGSRILHTSVPSTSRSRALTIYPSSVTNSPPQDLEAVLTVRPGSSSAPPLAEPWAVIHRAEAPLLGPGRTWSSLAQRLKAAGSTPGTQAHSRSAPFGAGRNDPLSDLMSGRALSLGVVLLSLVLAFWFGAGHALSPGHGKTMVAAYLVGSRGTALHALLLGLTVTVTHTAGVFALGLVTLYLSQYILPDQLYPWLGFTSGMLVALMGLTLFVRRLRGLGDGQRHDHVHGGHAHHHPHDHSHPHDHDHAHEHGEAGSHPHRHGLFGRPHTHGPVAAGARPGVSTRSLLALGVSGGLLPCPSALIVLLSAIAFHRVAFGIVLIAAFSAGLATTLTGVGVLVVYGSRLVGRLRDGRAGGYAAPALMTAARTLPVFSALVVAMAGTLIAAGALSPGALPGFLTRL